MNAATFKMFSLSGQWLGGKFVLTVSHEVFVRSHFQKSISVNPAQKAQNPMNHRNRWHSTAIAAAIAVIGVMGSFEAHALALGRINVLSALGEPLRAEIDIAEINAEEAASLKAGIARAEIFKAAGLEYTAIAANVNVTLQRRANGRPYFRLTSSGPVNEPFVDLVLEASWATGRITRDYTMLLDPPSLRPSSNANSSSPLLTAPALPPPPRPALAQTAPVPPPIAVPSVPRPVAPAPAAPSQALAPAVRPASSESLAGQSQQLTVQAGDTAGKIAARIKPASISLDQMLLALLRNNPDAFIGGNINRMRAGAVLGIPSAEQASAVAPGEARQTIVAQSQDFNAFRRKLAENVPATQVASADRQAAGRVQARVEDRTPASTTPDKLTLSQGAVQGKATTPSGAATTASSAEDKIARERQAREASTRVAELSKNISDLNRLSAASAPTAGAASAAKAASVPGISVATPAGLASSAPGTTPTPTTTAAPAAPAALAASPALSTAAANAAANAASAVAVAATAAASAANASVAAASVAASAASAALTAASTAPTVSATPAASAAANSASVPAATTNAAINTSALPTPPPAPPKPVSPPPPAAVAETSLVDDLLENPLVLPLVGLLLALLAGFGFYRYRQRQTALQEENAALDSRLQPDSFFGASGGQRIDTNEGTVTGSSLVYSPSQLDAAGDVDPVAEADVYLAYGRDLQAEEILKEALRTTPTRAAIHAKLLEIYAKRRDVKSFESLANQAYNLTQGNGPEWAYITEMGRELDPSNLTYQAGGRPPGARSMGAIAGAAGVAAVAAVALDGKNRFEPSSSPLSTQSMQPTTIPVPLQVNPPLRPAEADSASDLDLDLDFSLDDAPPSPPPPARAVVASAVASPPVASAAMPALDMGMDMEFSNSTAAYTLPSAAASNRAALASVPATPALASDNNDIDFFADGFDFTPEPLPTLTPVPPGQDQKAAALSPAASNDGSDMMDFDLSPLSLDQNPSNIDNPASPASSSAESQDSEDPLETKFLLAEEFRALGDDDTARLFAEEVLAGNPATPLWIKTQAFLNALS